MPEEPVLSILERIAFTSDLQNAIVVAILLATALPVAVMTWRAGSISKMPIHASVPLWSFSVSLVSFSVLIAMTTRLFQGLSDPVAATLAYKIGSPDSFGAKVDRVSTIVGTLASRYDELAVSGLQHGRWFGVAVLAAVVLGIGGYYVLVAVEMLQRATPSTVSSGGGSVSTALVERTEVDRRSSYGECELFERPAASEEKDADVSTYVLLGFVSAVALTMFAYCFATQLSFYQDAIGASFA